MDTGAVLESFEDSTNGVTLKVEEVDGVDKNILVIPLADVTTGVTSAFVEVTVGEVKGTGQGTAEADVEEIVLKTA